MTVPNERPPCNAHAHCAECCECGPEVTARHDRPTRYDCAVCGVAVNADAPGSRLTATRVTISPKDNSNGR